MIYLLAKDLEDARQWAWFNGARNDEVVFLFSPDRVDMLRPGDRLVRTACCYSHPKHFEIEAALWRLIHLCQLSEGPGGRLSRQAA